jgi:hypothetical protein
MILQGDRQILLTQALVNASDACNMKYRHCFRGARTPLNMSLETHADFLKQYVTPYFTSLTYSGGQAALNPSLPVMLTQMTEHAREIGKPLLAELSRRQWVNGSFLHNLKREALLRTLAQTDPRDVEATTTLLNQLTGLNTTSPLSVQLNTNGTDIPPTEPEFYDYLTGLRAKGVSTLQVSTDIYHENEARNRVPYDLIRKVAGKSFTPIRVTTTDSPVPIDPIGYAAVNGISAGYHDLPDDHKLVVEYKKRVEDGAFFWQREQSSGLPCCPAVVFHQLTDGLPYVTNITVEPNGDLSFCNSGILPRLGKFPKN